jgi:nucleotide-binding universal stress UspA family protein
MSSQQSTILVPIDENESSEAGLREAARIARGDGSRVVALAVGELPETSEHEEETRNQLERRLAEVIARVSGVPVQQRVELAGDPVRGILDVAREEQADRIVIASEQRSLLEALGHESVSDEVEEEADVPVRVVRTGNGR